MPPTEGAGEPEVCSRKCRKTLILFRRSKTVGRSACTRIVLRGFVGHKDEAHAEIQVRMLETNGYVTLRFDFRCCGEGERGQVRCFDQVADAKNAFTFRSMT